MVTQQTGLLGGLLSGLQTGQAGGGIGCTIQNFRTNIQNTITSLHNNIYQMRRTTGATQFGANLYTSVKSIKLLPCTPSGGGEEETGSDEGESPQAGSTPGGMVV